MSWAGENLLQVFLLNNVGTHRPRTMRDPNTWLKGDVLTFTEDTTLPEVFAKLTSENFLGAPVVEHVKVGAGELNRIGGRLAAGMEGDTKYKGFISLIDIVKFTNSMFWSREEEYWIELFRPTTRTAFTQATVRDVMQKPNLKNRDPFPPLSSDYSTFHALEMMALQKQLHRIALVDPSNNTLQSILTQSMLISCIAQNQDKWMTTFGAATVGEMFDSLNPVITGRAKDKAINCFYTMEKLNINTLPIVDDSNHLKTVLSIRDLRGIGADGSKFARLFDDVMKFKKRMRSDDKDDARRVRPTSRYESVTDQLSDQGKLVYVTDDQHITDVINLMDDGNQHSVIVCTIDRFGNATPVHVITQTDVLRAVLMHCKELSRSVAPRVYGGFSSLPALAVREIHPPIRKESKSQTNPGRIEVEIVWNEVEDTGRNVRSFHDTEKELNTCANFHLQMPQTSAIGTDDQLREVFTRIHEAQTDRVVDNVLLFTIFTNVMSMHAKKMNKNIGYNNQQPVLVIKEEEKLSRVFKKLVEAQISGAPIVSKYMKYTNKCISLRDIVRFTLGRMGAMTPEVERLQKRAQAIGVRSSVKPTIIRSDNHEFLHTQVQDIEDDLTHRDTVEAHVLDTASLHSVFELLGQGEAHRVVVIDAINKRVKNIITQSMMIHLLFTCIDELSEDIKKTTADDINKVHLLATCKVTTLAKDAFQEILDRDVSSIAIVDQHGNMTDVLSLTDIKGIGTHEKLLEKLWLPVSAFKQHVRNKEFRNRDILQPLPESESSTEESEGWEGVFRDEEREGREGEDRVREGPRGPVRHTSPYGVVIGTAPFSFPLSSEITETSTQEPTKERRTGARSKLVCVKPGDSFKKVLTLMITERVHRVYIVGSTFADDYRPIGVITGGDILAFVMKKWTPLIIHQSRGCHLAPSIINA